MPVLRTHIETALDEIISQEEGMRFQGLAVVLGKQRWPELIAHQRKKDFGLDAYAPASLTPENYAKGLAASITPTLKKVSDDARRAKENFRDLKALLFVTPAIVGNSKRREWREEIRKVHGLDLHIIEREEIIALMLMPENASLCASFLYLDIEAEPESAALIERTRRAAEAVTQGWAAKTKGHPLIDLAAIRLDRKGAESAHVLSLEQFDRELSQSGRIVLEAPAGRGKTTTLIQLAQRARTSGTPFIVELPSWATSGRNILEYIAGLPAFQAEHLTSANLAQVQRTEPFLFLLNGWNEIAESSSSRANEALRDLERDFPSAGIIVATRTHHLTPPLPGALRLRLLRLGRKQRAEYLDVRLGAKAVELRARIDEDPSLEELTRTPFVLSEVASLFEAGAEIPSTKIGILAEVASLQEQRNEHRNSLQASPIFGLQRDYLSVLATEMTRRGAVALSEADARAGVAAVARELVDQGQIERAEPAAVLANLTAHHLLERIENRETTFQFEHQQFQEYYATLDLRARLLDLGDDDLDGAHRFTADYVNDPRWAETLRMIAEDIAEQAGNREADQRNRRAAMKLVNMALTVDLLFAGELARLCGAAVWNDVRAAVGRRLRAAYALSDANYRQNAVAAMLATGADDFCDIILPVLSGEDQQARLSMYRLWPDVRLSSLGSGWSERVRGWSEDARTDFVSELLHHRFDSEIALFAAEDDSVAVKKAAAVALMWTGSEDAATRVLESMDAQTFEDVARRHPDDVPPALRPRAITAMRRFVETTADHRARLRTALNLIELGETGLVGIVKDAMAELPGRDKHKLDLHSMRPALEILREADPAWTSEWVTTRIAEGVVYGHEEWLPFATVIPEDLVEAYLHRLETEDLERTYSEGMIAIIATRADTTISARVFAKLRELRRKVDAVPGERHEFERKLMRQQEAVFRGLPDDVAADGVLSAVTSGDPLDIKVAVDLLSRVARSDVEPLHIADFDVRARLRAYLKGSLDLVLGQDDFHGEEKANLASSIAQVGEPEDMADLVTIIRADIERVHRGRAARAAGDRGPLGNGASVTCAGSHVAAVMHLDPGGAEQVLIDLLPEPEYCSQAAAAMARDFVPEREHPFDRGFRYDLIWAAREGRTPPPEDNQRRTRFAAALNAEIERLRGRSRDGKPAAGLKELAKALSAIDGRGSAAAVLQEISKPGQWDQYTCLEAAQRLLMAGVEMPAATIFPLVDSILERTGNWMSDPDRYLLLHVLALCPLVDDPAAGIAKMRDVINTRRLGAHELHEIVTSLGESRSDAAVDLLHEFASDAQTFEQCEGNFVNALAALDTLRARKLLLGFVEPGIHDIALTRRHRREDMLIERLVELAWRSPEVTARLLELCERDLPEINRHILSRVLARLGTPETMVANLDLIDDARSPSVPRGVREQLESAFVERQPYEQHPGTFTLQARASNGLRARLFKMAIEDGKRRKSAVRLLGQIEVWRLEYGRPADEPRHPDLASGLSWPPMEV